MKFGRVTCSRLKASTVERIGMGVAAAGTGAAAPGETGGAGPAAITSWPRAGPTTVAPLAGSKRIAFGWKVGIVWSGALGSCSHPVAKTAKASATGTHNSERGCVINSRFLLKQATNNRTGGQPGAVLCGDAVSVDLHERAAVWQGLADGAVFQLCRTRRTEQYQRKRAVVAQDDTDQSPRNHDRRRRRCFGIAKRDRAAPRPTGAQDRCVLLGIRGFALWQRPGSSRSRGGPRDDRSPRTPAEHDRSSSKRTVR